MDHLVCSVLVVHLLVIIHKGKQIMKMKFPYRWDSNKTIPQLVTFTGLSELQLRYYIKRDNLRYKRRLKFKLTPHLRWFPDTIAKSTENHRSGAAWDEISVYL
jgi:hypothetical protein